MPRPWETDVQGSFLTANGIIDPVGFVLCFFEVCLLLPLPVSLVTASFPLLCRFPLFSCSSRRLFVNYFYPHVLLSQITVGPVNLVGLC